MLVGAGPKSIGHMELKDKDGRLVYAETAPYPSFLKKYHAFRCTYCTTYRNAWTPPGFRAGKVNTLTLVFYLAHKLRRYSNG